MKYSTSLILASFSLLSLCACSPTSTSSSTTSTSSWNKAIQKHYHGLSSASLVDLNNLSIPVLKSNSLAVKWGAPKVEKSATGYRLSYADPKQPFRRLVVYGMGHPLPTLSGPPSFSGEEVVNGELKGFTRAQGWRSSFNIAGKSVRWFKESAGGGADGSYYSTEGFSATSNGKTGYYRIVVESGDGDAVEKEIQRWLRSISF